MDHQLETRIPGKMWGIVPLVLGIGAWDSRLSWWSWLVIVMISMVWIVWMFVQTKAKPRWLVVIAAAILAFVWLPLRVYSVRNSRGVSSILVPSGVPGSMWATLIPEEDAGRFAARWLTRWHAFPKGETDTKFFSAMDSAYQTMRHDHGHVASAMLPLYLGKDQTQQSESLWFPSSEVDSTWAVLFLHGFSGSSNVLCYQIAKPLLAHKVSLLCPALNPSAQWKTEGGKQVIDHSLNFLRRRGYKHIVLAGLSAGASGASYWATNYAQQLQGVMLISGASYQGSCAGLPCLIVEGDNDHMMTTSFVRSFAKKQPGPGVEYHELPGGHFIMVEQTTRLHEIVATWIQKVKSKPLLIK
jgi:pimeloyl-ACP methyl ester carboxylesterase